MFLKDAILGRRSIRNYNEQEVSRETIIELLNTAVYAPSHQFRQTWRFILIDGLAKDELLNNLDTLFVGVPEEEARLDYRKRLISTARAILVVINQKNDNDPIWTLEEYAASVALMQNFMLLAYEKGIGTCFKSKLFQSKLASYLNTNDNEMITGAITMGYVDEMPVVKERINPTCKLTIL